ncbi:hypothetical protein [Paenibacillus macerans]|uniref:hypothetical protein n=1 Tax=Paenibacillus macerans TaxID=44252 RepID=UPI00203EE42B|nr:hypothetical protein [Paenibacillus macerans]MCM3701105.1 hypothetical protein [Paenibacillus macerans]
MAAQVTGERRSDLKLVGNGESNGGSFNKVSIMGEGEIHGDVDCLTLKCTGSLELEGSLRAETAKATGNVTVKGAMEGRDLRITGNLDIGGELRVVKSRLNGDIRIGEGISGDNIQITGKCTVRSGCQAEHFRVKGAVQTEGTINADQVELWLLGPARAAEIVGGRISVAPQISWGLMPWMKSWGTPELQANVIEGDVIRLENTVCGVVRGGDVTIGPGCRIGLVEYTKQYHQDSHSEVKECLKGGGNDHE